MTLRRDLLYAVMRAYGIMYMGAYVPFHDSFIPRENREWNAGLFLQGWNVFLSTTTCTVRPS